MWTAIIIILVILIFLFQKDKKEMLDKIEAKGGLQEKYKEFLDFFIARHGFKSIKLTKSEMVLDINEPKVKMRVQLIQSFDKVLVHWHSINILGEVKSKWEFPDTMNQGEMTEKIMIDVFNKQSNNLQDKFKEI